MGQALTEGLGDKRGIVRFGFAAVPMEDSLAEVAIDLCGRPSLAYNAEYQAGKIGDFDVELVAEFMRSFSNSARMNLHVNVPYGIIIIILLRRYLRRLVGRYGRRWRWTRGVVRFRVLREFCRGGRQGDAA